MSQKEKTMTFLLGFILTVLPASPVQADTVPDVRARAERGEAEAQSNLGDIYVMGLEVTQNSQEAVKWFRKAANQSLAGAQFNLGYMYGNGQGVAPNYIQALKWYILAAARLTGANHSDAANMQNILEARMTAAEVAEAQQLAQQWPSVTRGR